MPHTVKVFPEGDAYWSLSHSLEANCEAATDLTKLEVSTRLGTVLSLLYRMASCYWGCHKLEHAFEYLAGRTCTTAHSAHRLIGFGYYDEALALSRNIAEIGNLVHLFFSDTSHVRRWLDLPDRERRREYTPAEVRRRLTKLGSVVPTDKDQYSWLCEIGTHVTPRTKPQAHGAEERPILGAVFQNEGQIAALHSLAWSVCTVSAPMAKLAVLEREHAERLFEESIGLVTLL